MGIILRVILILTPFNNEKAKMENLFQRVLAEIGQCSSNGEKLHYCLSKFSLFMTLFVNSPIFSNSSVELIFGLD